MFGIALSALSSFLSSKAGPALFMVMGVAAAIGFSMYYFENKAHERTIADAAAKIERAEMNVRTMEEAVRDATKAVETQRATFEAERESHRRLQTEYTLIEKDLADAQSKLTSYRGRWENASRKAGLLSRLANRATRKRVRTFTTATCRQDCDGDGGSGDNAGATPETEADPGS